MDNIFMHDASPTWSGFLYQGQIAVYLALKEICELRDSGKEAEIGQYYIEMEKSEDIAIYYEDVIGKQYLSIHQVKNQRDTNLSKYKEPLIQLMLERGFWKKNNYGDPEAYLHVSRKIVLNDEDSFAKKIEEWKKDIIKFYKNLCNWRKELDQYKNEDTILEKLEESVSKNLIGIKREKYTNLLKDLEKLCEKRERNQAKSKLEELLAFLETEFCILEISKEVKLYEYDNGENYCCGTDVFLQIVDYVKRYKANAEELRGEEYEYIADRILRFVQRKILERHNLIQENKEAIESISLGEFKTLLDEGMEKYEEDANVLALIRIYDECMEEYCNICQEENSCQGIACKLQHPEYRRNTLGKAAFIKFCYNLNPECTKTIKDRACLNDLLSKDGMPDSVFEAIKKVPEKYFIKKDDKTHFEVMNQDKAAFITAISGKRPSRVVASIVKAMETNQDLIETIFDADQLVTTRIYAPSSVWDNSCVKIRMSDLTEEETEGIDFEEHSIYVAKKPQFITSEQLIESVGK